MPFVLRVDSCSLLFSSYIEDVTPLQSSMALPFFVVISFPRSLISFGSFIVKVPISTIEDLLSIPSVPYFVPWPMGSTGSSFLKSMNLPVHTHTHNLLRPAAEPRGQLSLIY